MKIEILELADVLNNIDLASSSFKEAIDLIESIMDNDFENGEGSLTELMCSGSLKTSGIYLLFAKIPFSYYTYNRRQHITLDIVKEICEFGLEMGYLRPQELYHNLLSETRTSMVTYWLGCMISEIENTNIAKCMEWQ